MTIRGSEVLYLDFTGKYRKSTNFVVSDYDRINSINIHSKKIEEINIFDYEEGLAALIDDLSINDRFTLKAAQAHFFRNVIEVLLQWQVGIEEGIKKNHPDQVDFGDMYSTTTIFTYEAEGEVNNKWLYISNYFIPHLLLSYFKEKYPSIKFIYKKRMNYKVLFHFYLRNVIYLNMTFLVAFTRWLCSFFYAKPKINTSGKIGLLVRNSIQSDFALKLYDSMPESFYLISYEQVFSVNKNSSYLKSKGTVFFDASKNLNFHQLIRAYIGGWKNVFRKRKVKELLLVHSKLRIPMEYALKDLTVRGVDFYNYYQTLIAFRNKKVISFDMFTPHSHYAGKAVGEGNITQVQTTLISPKYATSFIAGDFFIFTDSISYNGFTNINIRFKNKLLLIDNPKFISTKQKSAKTGTIKNIIYFSQPYELESEKNILTKLKMILDKENIALSLKCHPRQNGSSYSFLMGVEIISDVTDFDYYDLAITRSSSIGMDCWAENLPIVFIRDTIRTKSISASYIPDEYNGDLSCIDDINKILADYPAFVRYFHTARRNGGFESDINHTLETIKGSLDER